MTHLYPAVMVVADADHDGWFDHMGGWGGWWVVFPVVMVIFMFLIMSRMFFPRRAGSGGRVGDGSDANATHGRPRRPEPGSR